MRQAHGSASEVRAGSIRRMYCFDPTASRSYTGQRTAHPDPETDTPRERGDKVPCPKSLSKSIQFYIRVPSLARLIGSRPPLLNGSTGAISGSPRGCTLETISTEPAMISAVPCDPYNGSPTGAMDLVWCANIMRLGRGLPSMAQPFVSQFRIHELIDLVRIYFEIRSACSAGQIALLLGVALPRACLAKFAMHADVRLAACVCRYTMPCHDSEILDSLA